MLRSRARWIAWIPVVIWMALIFAGSTDLLASSNTSRFLVPLIRWVAPGLSAKSVTNIQVVIRKGGHAFEYAVLALLVWHTLGTSEEGISSAWTLRRASLSWGLATTYALSDEFHQSFVNSREGRLFDVAVDSTGAAIALLLLRLWLLRRSKPQS